MPASPHPEATIVGTEPALVPHFLGGLRDELVAVQAAFDGLALHAAGSVSVDTWLVDFIAYNLSVSRG